MRKILALLASLALVVVLTGAASAQTDKPATDAAGEVPAEPSAYVSVDFQQGFVLEPFLVSVNGGGEVDSSTLDESCVGWINDKPVVSVNWQGQVEQDQVFKPFERAKVLRPSWSRCCRRQFSLPAPTSARSA